MNEVIVSTEYNYDAEAQQQYYYRTYTDGRVDIYLSSIINIDNPGQEHFQINTEIDLPITVYQYISHAEGEDYYPSFYKITTTDLLAYEDYSMALITPAGAELQESEEGGANSIKVFFNIHYGQDLQAFKCELLINSIWDKYEYEAT